MSSLRDLGELRSAGQPGAAVSTWLVKLRAGSLVPLEKTRDFGMTQWGRGAGALRYLLSSPSTLSLRSLAQGRLYGTGCSVGGLSQDLRPGLLYVVPAGLGRAALGWTSGGGGSYMRVHGEDSWMRLVCSGSERDPSTAFSSAVRGRKTSLRMTGCGCCGPIMLGR